MTLVRRLMLLVLSLTAALATLLVSAPLARADDDTPRSWEIDRYTLEATPDRDGGRTKVVLELVFDFSDDEGHGPFIVLPERARIAGDADHWRMLDTTITAVSSPTGANTEQKIDHEEGNLVLRIGSSKQTYTGEQTYRVEYEVSGLISPDNATSGLDEISWNAVGAGWQVPIQDVTVTLHSPVAATRTACFTGSSFAKTCAAPQPGRTLTWTTPSLSKETGLQVVAGYPVGTFTNAGYRTERRIHPGYMFRPTATTGIGAGVVGVLALGTVLVLARRKGLDEAYEGTIPGLIGTAGATGRRTRTETAVAFQPPEGARPAEIGVLMSERFMPEHVTATVVDLAVRGHLVITPVDKKNQTYTRTDKQDGLVPYEQRLLKHMFRGQKKISTADLRKPDRADMLEKGEEDLYRRVSEPPLTWFPTSPKEAQGAWYLGGIILTAVGVVATLGAGLLGFGLVPIGILVAGVVVMALAPRMATRTAAGSAVHEQAKGFELYLRTAEADQIRFEEGIDVFSRYLPYAIVFRVTDRWVKVFDQLAAEGRYSPDYSWYGAGHGFPGGSFHAGFADSFSGLTSSMSSAVSASVASSDSSSGGGSGFSGGGGVGGGGGGGW